MDAFADEGDPELAGKEEEKKNWKGIFIAIGVIASIFGLVAAAIYFSSNRETAIILGEPIGISQALNLHKQLRSVNFKWSTRKGNDLFVFLNESSGDLEEIEFLKNNDSLVKRTFFSKNDFSRGELLKFDLSADGTVLLLSDASESTGFTLVKVSSGRNSHEVTHRNLKPKPFKSKLKIDLVRFGDVGSFVSFVYNGNIYYADDPYQMIPVSITNNSEDKNISYGLADPIYQKHILYSKQAFWISTDAKRIAYLKFNVTNLPVLKLTLYGSPSDLYLKENTLRYPKAGDTFTKHPVPVVTVHVYNILSTVTVNVHPPESLASENYVSLVRWLNESHLLIGWLNREQTSVQLSVCDVESSMVKCRTVYGQTTESEWIDFYKQASNEPLFNPADNKLYLILHNRGFRRIAELSLSGYNQIRWISPASYDVTDLLRLEEQVDERRYLYFTSCRTSEDACISTDLHLQRISVSPDHPTTTHCITCKPRQPSCEYNEANFSPSGRVFLQSCLGPNPHVYMIRKTCVSEYPLLTTVEDNEAFKASLQGKHQPIAIYKEVLLPGMDQKISIKLTAPRQLNESHITQYPLLLWIKSTPGSQSVTKKFEVGWETYLASSLFFVVAIIDGRGSTNKGSDFLFSVKQNLAKIDLQDQLEGLKFLKKMPFVNRSTVAVYGRSYGGLLALHLLGHPSNENNSIASTGIAVSPITDVQYYSMAFVERFLGIRSSSTSEFYSRTNISHLSPNFRNKELLLAHGMADEDVSYQNSAQFMKYLVRSEVDFEMVTYPDEDHSLSQSDFHLYRRMTEFLMNSFNRTSEKHKFLNSELHGFCSKSSC